MSNSSAVASATTLTILDNDIRCVDGLYSLNDLHRASGGAAKHQPNRFLRLEQTQALIAAIDAENANEINKYPDMGISQSAENFNENNKSTFTQRGVEGGTYVCKEIVIAYAAWISPKFHLAVIRAFLATIDDDDDDDYQPTEYEMAIKRANSIIPMVMDQQCRLYEHDKLLHELAPLRGVDHQMLLLNYQMQFLLSYFGLDNDYSHNSSGDDSQQLKDLFNSKHREGIREHCRQFFRNYVLLRINHGLDINHGDDPEQLAVNLAQYFQLCYDHHLPNFGKTCEPVTTVAGLNNMHQLQTMLKSPDNCSGRFLKCAKIPTTCERLPFASHGPVVDCLIFECDVEKLVGIIAERDPRTGELPRR